MMKGAKIKPVKVEKEEHDFELQSIWPQLSKVLKWLIVNEVDKAVEVLKVVACRRKHELEIETEKIIEKRQLMLDQVKNRDTATIENVLIEVCCGVKSKLTATFKERGGEAIQIYLPNHNMLKRYTMKA